MREEWHISAESVRGLCRMVVVAKDEHYVDKCFSVEDGTESSRLDCDSLAILLSPDCCTGTLNDKLIGSSIHIECERSQMWTRSKTNTMTCVAQNFAFLHGDNILNALRYTKIYCNIENSDINNNYNDNNDNTDSNNHNENNRNNNSDGSNSGNGDNNHNERDDEEDEAHMNNNSNNEEGNNNNGDGNDEKEKKNTVEEDDAEDEEEENSDDEDNMMNGNSKNSMQDENVKRYLLNKLTFEDIEKTDSRLSIISNTPYDSIEAQSKHNIVADKKEHFVELINIKSSSLSDEFSGTESMEYIQYNDHEKLVTDSENWYTNLITIHPPQIAGDSNSLDSTSSQLPDSSEVHVITGNDTLSAVICLEEGLADDDSWVEELDHDDFPEESSDGEEITYIERAEDRYYNRNDIDLTLHTIFEESGEDSESEPEKGDSTQLEKYFVFEIGGKHSSSQSAIQDADSISESMSESSSTISEGLDPVNPENSAMELNSVDLPPSRLEKYFLSGFMGFNKRDSDGSVGSDSEGKQSPEQRRKKVVRARGSNRHSSLDNLNEEQQILGNSESQFESSNSEGEANEENSSFDKNDDQFDTIKRIKKKKRSQISSVEHLENIDSSEGAGMNEESSTVENTATAVASTIDLNLTKETDLEETNPLKNESVKHFLSSTPHGLTRKDSFNNWSSDEETNLMMSKMRTFFKNMIAQRKNASPVNKNRNKPPQLIYFESELTRLMKTVPGLRDDQVKEIVEYLSSEDTWSDSYDSSDYTSSDLEVGTKKNPFQPNISVDSCKVPDINIDGKKDTDLVYQCLMSSFQRMEPNSDSSTSRNSPPLMNKVMQHIGTKLVALMHEVTEGTACTPKAGRYQRRMHSKLPTIATATEEEDDSIEERSPLPRSKSYDPLLEESRQETSDNERFSWRGSFESALMTGSDSRTRLPSAGENSASALVLATSKRRSAGDLLLKSGNNSREHLDRVRSCGSIGGGIEDKIWSMRHARKRRSSVPDERSNSGESADGENDSDDDNIMEKSLNENVGKSTTLPRTLQALNTSTTNSLPRLSSSPSPNIYKVNSLHSFGVKSARYRPPGYNSRNSPGSYHTMCAPPRREYNRRRQTQLMASPPSVLSSTNGTGDDCSVSSDLSERTSIMDNELEKSHSRISTVSVTRSDSMASVYSGTGEGRYGIVPIRGEVEFSLQYNYKAGNVEIHVKRCSDLAPVDQKRNRSDPYVKVYLLPDKSKSGKRKTRVKKHTLNPVFDEVLKYHVSLEELESRTLWLSVWHSDIFGRNDFLGEVVVPLVNKVFDDPSPKVYVLKERSEMLDNVSTLKRELIVALKFVLPADNKSKEQNKETGSLHVLVKEAKNLIAAKSNGTSDPFCKSYLLPNKGRTCKQKTPILKRTCHPIWNHTFVYNNVTLDELSQRCLELTIWDHDRLASNEFLGGVRLSLGTGLCNDKSVDWMDSNNREVALWQRMLDHRNFWVESSLILKSSLDIRAKN